MHKVNKQEMYSTNFFNNNSLNLTKITIRDFSLHKQIPELPLPTYTITKKIIEVKHHTTHALYTAFTHNKIMFIILTMS